MAPARLNYCDQAEPLDRLENKFVPDVNIERSEFCGVGFADESLVGRCRQQRALKYRADMVDVPGFSEVVRPLSRPADLQCPARDVVIEDHFENEHDMQKYRTRMADGQCHGEEGMWGGKFNAGHKCVLVTVAHLLGFLPGQLVLDWGSGCGHMLTWAKALFDVDGVGIEAVQAAVKWSTVHGIGKFCYADGRFLD